MGHRLPKQVFAPGKPMGFASQESISVEGSIYRGTYFERLKLLYLPRYFPELSPQENIWKLLKDYRLRLVAYTYKGELKTTINQSQLS